MRRILVTLSIAVTLLLMVLSTSGSVAASPPDRIKGDMFICPSVSPNNPNGKWVIGGSGAYYVNFPGTASPNWPMFLNPFKAVEENPADVEGQAQRKAGWGLYHRLQSYPYLYTMEVGKMAMVLDDGFEYVFDEFGINLTDYGLSPMPMPPMIHVTPSATPSFNNITMTLYANVTLASAVFW